MSLSIEFLLVILLFFILLLLSYYFYKTISEKNIKIFELEKENEKLLYKNELDLKRLSEQKEELKFELGELTQKLLESKIKSFDETSIKSLETLLKPFKENIESFKQKVEYSQKESGERLSALSKEIELVLKTGMMLSQETQNLTSALKGEKKTQGNWGEMILDSILDKSGLIKDEHYFIQESYKDEHGSYKRPDIIVKLPSEKSIIIDSKVSLVDYDNYISSDEEQKISYAKNISKAFKAHIDTLNSKEYSRYDINTLEYVLMFVPIESAYAIAISNDNQLYEYAINKHIIIVYPSTLMITLKTIHLHWQRDKADLAVEKIFIEAGKLYDKVESFIRNFDKIGSSIESLSKVYEISQKQLYSGSGNIYKKTEDLKALGAKTTKTLSKPKDESFI